MLAISASVVLLESGKSIVHVFIDLHKAGEVIASVAIVGRRPNGYQVFVCKPFLVSFLDELMGPCYEFNIIEATKVVDDFFSEKPSSAPLVLGPGVDLFRV